MAARDSSCRSESSLYRHRVHDGIYGGTAQSQTFLHSINPDVCTECGTCADVCPNEAISLPYAKWGVQIAGMIFQTRSKRPPIVTDEDAPELSAALYKAFKCSVIRHN